MRWLIGPRLQRRLGVFVNVLARVLSQTTPPAFIAQVDAILDASDELRFQLPSVTAPTLVITGSQDTLTPLGDAEEVAELIPHARLYVLRRGTVVTATQDHSRVQQMIDAGEITEEAAARHPDRNKIYSCLGGVVPPQITTGKELALEAGDTILLSTDGFWSQIPASILGTMLRKQTVVELMPGLLSEAHRRAKGESDNLSVVAMTWENQDDTRIADTSNLDNEQFATSANTTQQLDVPTAAEEVTDDDIERAIAEIQDAIRKVPR